MHRVIVMCAAGALTWMTALPPGHAATPVNQFTCRASALREVGKGLLAGVGTIEPVVANAPNVPCLNATAGPQSVVVDPPQGYPMFGAVARVASALTGTDNGQDARAATVVGSVSPTGFEVDHAQANVDVVCDGTGHLLVSGSATVLGLRIAGIPVSVPAGPFDIPLGPLGTLHVNQEIRTPTSLIERALYLEGPLTDIVLGEAQASYAGTTNPCA